MFYFSWNSNKNRSLKRKGKKLNYVNLYSHESQFDFITLYKLDFNLLKYSSMFISHS